MVVIDQLRLTEDGENLILDAHVNKASYFNNVYIDSVGIDTQDTALQTFSGPSSDAIYRKSISASDETYLVTENPVVLTEYNLYDTHKTQDNSGIKITTSVEEGATNIISFGFRGEFNGTNLVARVLGENSLTYTEFEGTQIDSSRHLWEFKGKLNIGNSSYFTIHIYNVVNTTYTLVPITRTLNIYSLHLIYNLYRQYSSTRLKEVHLIINKGDFTKSIDMTKTLFYVYVHTAGYPSPSCPCRLDEPYTLGVTFDAGMLYNQMMGYTKEIAQDCSVPKNFVNVIILLEALRGSIETENYASANKFFNRLINSTTSQGSPKTCGCNG